MGSLFRTRLGQAIGERAPAGLGRPGPATVRDLVLTFELVPARASRGKAVEGILNFAREAAKDRLLSALSITDNAGGHPALAPDTLGQEIQAMGLESIIHFSCKDKNRNIIESQLFELDRYGLRNLLVLTGDYPRYGYLGNAKPVFDLDSVHVLGMVSDMNAGFQLDSRAPGGGAQLPPMHFHAGCVVSPFKRYESELVPQYLKLKRKVAAGARFAITQMGFDLRKYDELRRFMDREQLQVPLLGTVFVPTLGLARILHEGVVPGCLLPLRLLESMEHEAGQPDRGLAARLERAARLMAALWGIGYEGVHLSGPGLTYDQVAFMVRRARELAPHWREFAREFLFPEEWNFWYFREDPETGLNTDEPSPRPMPHLRPAAAMGLAFGQLVHDLAFVPGQGVYPLCERLARALDRSVWKRPFEMTEFWIKGALYACRHCGDCTLGELGFLCPQSRCAKHLLNGACGGSRDGWCEVWPGQRRCFYVRAYERLRRQGREDRLAGPPIPPRNWSLFDSASWLNYYLGRDHAHVTKNPVDIPH